MEKFYELCTTLYTEECMYTVINYLAELPDAENYVSSAFYD